ncbi:MAG: hypothetical protein AAB492_00285 [Patescibacteria group bacterium]
MHSYLIIGQTDDRDKEIQSRLLSFHISPFDTIVITESETSVGIKDVREFITKLQLIPSQSPKVAGIIPDASRLTRDAQQAILKTLEEPPAHAVIFLGVTQKNVLLETILSRCESIILKTAPVDVGAFHSITPTFIDELVVASSGNRLSMLSLPCKTKEDSRIFLSEAIVLLQKKLLQNPTQGTGQIGTIITRLIKLYDVNQSSMNMQLLIENAFL